MESNENIGNLHVSFNGVIWLVVAQGNEKFDIAIRSNIFYISQKTEITGLKTASLDRSILWIKDAFNEIKTK